MGRHRKRHAENDERGSPLYVRLSTTIRADHYNWVAAQPGRQFGAMLDRAIQAAMLGTMIPDDASPVDLAGRAFKAVVAARARGGTPMNAQEVDLWREAVYRFSLVADPTKARQAKLES